MRAWCLLNFIYINVSLDINVSWDINVILGTNLYLDFNVRLDILSLDIDVSLNSNMVQQQ